MADQFPNFLYDEQVANMPLREEDGMSRMDYYVQSCVCGYVVKFFWSRSELI